MIDTDQQLSPHFWLSEFVKSSEPTDLEIGHLRLLCTYLLEPIRVAWNNPITVTSGYRSKAHNANVGGSKTSAHILGYAADIVPTNGDIAGFKSFVKAYLSGATFSGDLQFDQCIDEKNAKGSEWVHIGLMNGKGEQRGQFLITNDGVHYTKEEV